MKFLANYCIIIVLLTSYAHLEEKETIEDEIAICDSNQRICLQMASHYFSSGESIRGFKLLVHRAKGGESVDIYNYAYNLKKFKRIEWKHWMGIAAGLGDSNAQIELIPVRPKTRKNDINQNLFNIYLLATYEDDGVLSCIDVMKTAISLNKNQFLISALRRS